MSSPAWYALRRTLTPWNFDELLDELVVMAPHYKIDEVILKTDTEEFTHGQPPLDWVRAYQPKMFQAKAALERIGVAYSLNPWITVGHCDRGRDARKQLPGLQTAVGPDGTQTAVAASPLCPVWRTHVEQVWTLYAQTQPKVMWIEDDIRTFNHAPIEYGPFDPLVLDRFAQRLGEPVTREQVVAALFQAGPPHPWRALWLDLVGDIMVETVAFLAHLTHRVSPDTCIGLMSSGPRMHAIEGRKWAEFAAALADGRTLYSRPPLGSYSEASLRGLYYSADSINLSRSVLPGDTVEQTEVENVPFTRYADSINFTFAKIAVSFACGVHGVTLNLFDHCGTPMQREPHFGRMLGERKAMLNALAAVAQQPGRMRGVGLLHHDRASIVKHLEPSATWRNLIEDGEPLAQALGSLGVATTYEPENVTAVSGQVLRAFDNQTIHSMLSDGRGLFLDGVAARVLVERGFGKLIGLTDVAPAIPTFDRGPRSAEELIHPDFAGQPGKYLTTTMPDLMLVGRFCPFSPAPGAMITSRLVDPDNQPIEPAMIAYKNERGGRVVVHGWEYESVVGSGFFGTFRREQIHAAVRWLSADAPTLLVDGDGVYPLVIRKDLHDGRILLVLFNLSLDAWPSVHFRLAAAATRGQVQQLDRRGAWQTVDATITTTGQLHDVALQTRVTFDEPLCLLLA
jgi:hypothetical protein